MYIPTLLKMGVSEQLFEVFEYEEVERKGACISTRNCWVSEASPTLGVQSRFRVICICYSTGKSDIRDIFHEL